jgi:hypothetical protein
VASDRDPEPDLLWLDAFLEPAGPEQHPAALSSEKPAAPAVATSLTARAARSASRPGAEEHHGPAADHDAKGLPGAEPSELGEVAVPYSDGATLPVLGVVPNILGLTADPVDVGALARRIVTAHLVALETHHLAPSPTLSPR